MDINHVLAELGNRVGLDGLALDDRGLCRLVFDQHLIVDLEADPDGHTVHLHGIVAPLPPEGREALYEQLLDANLADSSTGGAHFALDRQRGEILLERALDMDRHDYQDLVNVLESLVNHLESWQERLQQPASGSPQNHDYPPMHGLGGGFIRA